MNLEYLTLDHYCFFREDSIVSSYCWYPKYEVKQWDPLAWGEDTIIETCKDRSPKSPFYNDTHYHYESKYDLYFVDGNHEYFNLPESYINYIGRN